MDEDRGGAAGVAGAADSGEDLGGGKTAKAGVGSEEADGAVEGVAAGVEEVFGEEGMGNPFAEAAG